MSSQRAVDASTARNLFDQVSQKLASIGCIPLTDYLYELPSIPKAVATAPQQALSNPPPNHTLIQQAQSSASVTTNPSVDTVSANPISRLHHSCQRIFGSIEPLKFEFIEEGGQRSNYLLLHPSIHRPNYTCTGKKCILTISRPNGSIRSYATEPVYSRKSEAKSAAANLAIEMGALDFITNDDPQESRPKRGLVLSSINTSENQEGTTDNHSTDILLQVPADNDAVKQIEDCCWEWRGRFIVPHWVALLEPKVGRSEY